jgi:hypothetical protein
VPSRLTEPEKALHRALGPHHEKVFGPRRTYRRVTLAGGGVQYQVITAVGFHWRHIAVVNVKDGKASKAERYFYSLRAPRVVLPFEAIGRDYLVDALKEMREIEAGRGPVRGEGPRPMEMKIKGGSKV